MKKMYLLTTGSMVVLFLILIISLFRLYEDKEELLVKKLNSTFEEVLKRFSEETMVKDSSCQNVVSYSYSNNEIFLVKSDDKFVFKSLKVNDVSKIHITASYDIRDSKRWTLKALDSLFVQRICDIQVHYIFILQDSTNKVLDVLKKGINRITPGKEVYTVQLGLFEKDVLYADFTLPVMAFLQDEWAMVLYLLASVMMLLISIYWMSSLIRKERKIRENEELNIQTVNHDMRSPVNLAKLNLSLLEREGIGSLSEKQLNNLNTARAKLMQLDDMIARMATRWVNKRGLVLQINEFDLKVLVEEIVTEVHTEILPSKKVKFSITYYMDGDALIWGDRLQLGRALGNLLRNAVKYSGEEVKISVTCLRRKKKVLISVKDDGFGIDESDRAHIFEAGYRSPAIEKRTGGCGLGLSFVQMVVRAHRGEVLYRKGFGHGSKFIMIFYAGKHERYPFIIRR